MEIERRFSDGIPRATVPYVERPSLPGGGVHGAARWLTTEETIAADLYKFGGVMFGQSSKGYLTYSGDGHSMIVAPPGAGKGVGFVTPNLVCYPGSMIVIDPKGENAAQTALHRRNVLKQNVFVLDPCGVTGLPSDSYNPLSWLDDTDAKDFLPELKVFAEAVIESGYGKETYWTNCARSLFVGLACYLAAHDIEKFNLNEIYRLTRLPFDQWLQLWKFMAASASAVPAMQQLVRDYGAWYLSQHPDHQLYHLGTVQEATSWMGYEAAARVMGRSDFDIRKLKNKPTTIYVCVHPTQLSAYRGWFRLIVSQAIMSVFQSLEKPRNENGSEAAPVLFMLDEFARAVGKMSVVDDALPQIRQYGGRFAFVLQTIGQLKALYPHDWSTFEEACGLRVYLNSRGETAEHVSKRLGPTTVTVPASAGFSQTSRPLLYPQEVTQLGKLSPIAFVEELAPIMCHRITSHEDKNFKNYLRHFDGARLALPPDAPLSMLQQVRAADAGRKAPPTVTPEQKADLTRLNNGDWGSAAPTSPIFNSADEREAAFLSRLSSRCGKRVIRNDAGLYGYEENGQFVELG